MGKTLLGIAELVAGAVLIIVGLLVPPLTAILLPLGSSLFLAGLGTLLSSDPTRSAGIVKSPVTPWRIVYGLTCVPGNLIYINESGSSNKYLSMVLTLAAHACEALVAVRFNGKRLTMSQSGNVWTSFTPLQQTINISTITRTGDRVVVTLVSAFTESFDGDDVQISNITTDPTLNGKFVLQVIGTNSFSYTCGGSNVSISGQGHITTTFPDYSNTVRMEVALGTQTGNPFPLLTSDSGGQWDANHQLLGHTAVSIRLQYDQNRYAAGIPQIDFILKGKNDLYDPRTGTTGYSSNAALCIYDYLSNSTWGLNAARHTELVDGPWISAANVCDETIALANGGAESRYVCNGSFQVSSTTGRGVILSNLLTSCAGRFTFSNGQYNIQPGAWTGVDLSIGDSIVYVSAQCAPWDSAGGTRNTAICVSGQDGSQNLPAAQWVNPVNPGDVVTISCLRGTCSVGPVYECGLFGPLGDPSNTGSTAINTLMGFTGLYPGALLGAFVDASGNVKQALPVGTGGTWTAPAGTTAIQFGISDGGGSWIDNYGAFVLSVSSTGAASSLDPYAISTSPIIYKPKLSTRDLYNGVKAVYISPLNSWQRGDAPPMALDSDHGYSSDVYLAQDGGNRRWLNTELPFTTSCATAQRLSKIALMRSRMQAQATFGVNMAGYLLQPLSIVQITVPELGWARKQMEVSTVRFTLDKQNDVTVMGTSLDMVESESGIYDWNPATEELPPQGYTGGSLASYNTITSPAPPTGVAVTSNSSTSSINSSGTSTSNILLTWTTPADAYVTGGGHIAIQTQIAGASTWTSQANGDPSADSFTIGGYSDGTSVNVQVASVNVAGAQSAWVAATGSPVTVSGAASTLAPSGIATTGATPGQVLAYNGTSYAPTTITNLTAVEETPSGTIPGTAYGLSYAPAANTLNLSLNGLLLQATTDYTISGNSITLLFSTQAGDDLYATYSH